MDSTSEYYHDYYNNIDYGNTFQILYTKKELNDMLNGTHRIFKLVDIGGKSGTGGYLGIDIQVEDVFDSTASAKYFKHLNTNIKLRKGDIFLY